MRARIVIISDNPNEAAVLRARLGECVDIVPTLNAPLISERKAIPIVSTPPFVEPYLKPQQTWQSRWNILFGKRKRRR